MWQHILSLATGVTGKPSEGWAVNPSPFKPMWRNGIREMITDFTTYHREYWHKRRAKLIAYLGDCCVKCGSKENLEIDHIDPSQKSFHISQRASLTPRTMKELDKCQLLCENCHWAKTAQERSGFSHGKQYAWQRLKCQCAQCLKAKWEWHDKRNAKRRRGPGYDVKHRRVA